MDDQKMETLGEKAYNEITSSLIDNSNNNTINDLLTVEIPQEPIEINNSSIQPVESVSTRLIPFVDDDINDGNNNEEYPTVENYDVNDENVLDDYDDSSYPHPYDYYNPYENSYYNGYIEENTMSLKKRLIISVIITVVLLVGLYFIYYYCYLKNKKSIQKKWIILIVVTCLLIPVATWIIYG